jgi:hypothetical protein
MESTSLLVETCTFLSDLARCPWVVWSLNHHAKSQWLQDLLLLEQCWGTEAVSIELRCKLGWSQIWPSDSCCVEDSAVWAIIVRGIIVED